MTTREAARPLRRYMRARVRAASLAPTYTITRDVTQADFQAFLHADAGGAHGRIRTPIFNSDYVSPVRSRRRLRARIGAASGP